MNTGRKGNGRTKGIRIDYIFLASSSSMEVGENPVVVWQKLGLFFLYPNATKRVLIMVITATADITATEGTFQPLWPNYNFTGACPIKRRSSSVKKNYPENPGSHIPLK